MELPDWRSLGWSSLEAAQARTSILTAHFPRAHLHHIWSSLRAPTEYSQAANTSRSIDLGGLSQAHDHKSNPNGSPGSNLPSLSTLFGHTLIALPILQVCVKLSAKALEYRGKMYARYQFQARPAKVRPHHTRVKFIGQRIAQSIQYQQRHNQRKTQSIAKHMERSRAQRSPRLRQEQLSESRHSSNDSPALSYSLPCCCSYHYYSAHEDHLQQLSVQLRSLSASGTATAVLFEPLRSVIDHETSDTIALITLSYPPAAT